MSSRRVVGVRFTMRVSGFSFGVGEFGDEVHLLDGRSWVVYRLQFEHGALGEVAATFGSERPSMAVASRNCFSMCSQSGWATRVRIIEATMSCYPCGITAWTSRMKKRR